MTKRRPALDPSQLDLGFGVPEPATSDGALGRLPKEIAAGVGAMLKGDGRSRYDVAGAVSRLLDEEVSKMMLDAYASEAREGHRISADRLLALVVATGRYDVLRAILRRIGADLLVGEEVYAAELGHVEAQMRELEARRRQLRAAVEPLERGRRG